MRKRVSRIVFYFDRWRMEYGKRVSGSEEMVEYGINVSDDFWKGGEWLSEDDLSWLWNYVVVRESGPKWRGWALGLPGDAPVRWERLEEGENSVLEDMWENELQREDTLYEMEDMEWLFLEKLIQDGLKRFRRITDDWEKMDVLDNRYDDLKKEIQRERE